MWVELTRLSRHRQTFTQHSCRFIKMSMCNTIMHFRSSFLCVCECVWWQPSCVFLWTTISHSTGQTNCWWRLRSGLQTAKSCSTFRSFVLDGSLQGQLHACSHERLMSPEVGERSTIICSLVRLLPCVLLTKEVAPWTVWIPEQHVCDPSRCHHTAVAPFERRCLYGEFMVLGLDSVQFGYNAESLLM